MTVETTQNRGLITSILTKIQSTMDAVIPPNHRSRYWEQIKSFASNRPKLTALILTHALLSGPPLLLFLLFTATVLVVSLVTAVLFAIVGALMFTGAAILLALVFLVPTLFLATLGATFVFTWGLGLYFALFWLNGGQSPNAAGSKIGNGISSASGGRLDWMVVKDESNSKLNSKVDAF